jgi:hypothetical protein
MPCCSSTCKDYACECPLYYQFYKYGRSILRDSCASLVLRESLLIFSLFSSLCDLMSNVTFQETNYNEMAEGDNLPGTPVFEGK